MLVQKKQAIDAQSGKSNLATSIHQVELNKHICNNCTHKVSTMKQARVGK